MSDIKYYFYQFKNLMTFIGMEVLPFLGICLLYLIGVFCIVYVLWLIWDECFSDYFIKEKHLRMNDERVKKIAAKFRKHLKR